MMLLWGLYLTLLGCQSLPPKPSTEEILVGTWVNERPGHQPGWESTEIPFHLRETLSLSEDDRWSSTKQWELGGEVKAVDLESGIYWMDAGALMRLVQASTTDAVPGTVLEDLILSVDEVTLVLRRISPTEGSTPAGSTLQYKRQVEEKG